MSAIHKKMHIEAVHPAHWKRGRLNYILSQCRQKKILVLGDVGVDRYTMGSVERISPEAPVPIVLVQEEKLKLGLAANVADNIHALGGKSLLVGVVGKDRGADDFRKLLKIAGIQSQHLVVDQSRRTVLKERVVSERQQLLRIDYENSHAMSSSVIRLLKKKFQSLISQADGIIIEDYAKGMLSKGLLESAFKAAKRAGILVCLDPNMKTSVEAYRGASVLTPNAREAEYLSGVQIRDQNSLCKAGEAILKSTGAEHVVITLGKDGMAIFSRGSSSVKLIPTFAREVYDVSGAGDTVIAVLSLALSSGATIEEASVLGNLAAGVEVGKRGTATVSPEEIQAALTLVENMVI